MTDARPYPYEAVTDGIVVRVRPLYLPQRSAPDRGQWVWSYDVELENREGRTAQLRDRTWLITDGHGTRERVHGPGVVGQHPTLKRGERFRYTSGCPLTTPSGFMAGHYTFVDEDGAAFDVAIPTFALDVPGARGRLN